MPEKILMKNALSDSYLKTIKDTVIEKMTLNGILSKVELEQLTQYAINKSGIGGYTYEN